MFTIPFCMINVINGDYVEWTLGGSSKKFHCYGIDKNEGGAFIRRRGSEPRIYLTEYFANFPNCTEEEDVLFTLETGEGILNFIEYMYEEE